MLRLRALEQGVTVFNRECLIMATMPIPIHHCHTCSMTSAVWNTSSSTAALTRRRRRSATRTGCRPNRPQDAVYPTSEVDNNGKPYAGANKYVIHIPKGQMPPYTAKVVSDAELGDIRAYLATIPEPPPAKSILLLNQ